MRTAALVMARKGSKRIPGKNIRLLSGRPLIQYTTDAIIRSGVFDKIILSTDDPQIYELYEGKRRIDLDARPAHLATDDVQCGEVILYLINRYSLEEKFEYVCMLSPTCPFRNENHIIESHQLLKEKKPDSIVSIKKFDFPPEFSLTIINGKIVKTWDGIVRTDDIESKYHPNGAIIWLKTRMFKEKRMTEYYTSGTLPYIMDWKSSIDIDNPDNFELAETLMKKFQGGKHEDYC